MSDSEDFDDDHEFEERCELDEDSDYDCNFRSDEKSAPIYLDEKEWFDEDLPFLYNQTRTRKVDPAKFIHPSIRSTVHRCKEYPGGIFIDEHGKPQENHPDTGMYKRLKSAPIHEIEEHLTHDEDDDIEDEEEEDDENDDDDDYEEKTGNDDEDDDYEEEEDDEEYEEDDFEDSEDEGTNKKYNEEEEKDPYVVKKKGQKRKLDTENENSASSKKLKSEHSENDNDEEEEENQDEDEDEYELTEEDQKIIRIPKPSDHLTDLQQDMASHEKMEQGRKNMADRIHRGRKLMSTIENYSEVWKKLNHKKGKHEKIKMVCYPNFYIREGEEPSCPISLVVVSKNKSNKIKIPALMDCTTFHLCCHHSKNDQTCTFKTLRVDELYKHVQKHLAT